jgi:hypothetical protein
MAEMKDLVKQLEELEPTLSEVGDPHQTFTVELSKQRSEPSIHLIYDIYLNEEDAQELVERIKQKRSEPMEVQKLRDWFSRLKHARDEDEHYNQILDEIELHVEELDDWLLDEDDEDH